MSTPAMTAKKTIGVVVGGILIALLLLVAIVIGSLVVAMLTGTDVLIPSLVSATAGQAPDIGTVSIDSPGVFVWAAALSAIFVASFWALTARSGRTHERHA